MKNSTATILIVIAIGLFYTFTSPQYATVKNLQAESDEYRKVLDGAEAISETSAEIEDRYREIPRAEIERLSKVLPDDVDSVRLALDLDGIAGKYGIALEAVEVDRELSDNSGVIAVGDGKAYDRVTVTVTFLSNYANFVAFLTDLEKSLRISNIRTLYFKANDVGIYEHKVSIDTYWLK